MMRSNTLRTVLTVLTVLMDVLIAWAAIVTLSMVVRFFGAVAAGDLAGDLLAFAGRLVLPFASRAIATPYGGAFEIAAALTVLVALVAEWLLSLLRRRLHSLR